MLQERFIGILTRISPWQCEDVYPTFPFDGRWDAVRIASLHRFGDQILIPDLVCV